MLTRLVGVVALLAFACTGYAQDKKELDKQAKEKIKAWKKEWRKAKEEDAAIGLVHKLGETQHDKILKEFSRLLKDRRQGVVEAALQEIGRYRENDYATGMLVSSASGFANQVKRDKDGAETNLGPMQKAFRALGDQGNRPAALKITRFFSHASVEVCKASMNCAAALRNVEVVDHLIKILFEMEQVEAQATAPPGGMPNPPPGMGAPPGAPPGAPGMPPGAGQPPPGAQNQLQQEQLRRKNQIKPSAESALQAITGHKEDSASNWSKWWSKNKSALIKKQRAEDKAKKKKK